MSTHRTVTRVAGLVSGRDVRVRGLFIVGRLDRSVGCGVEPHRRAIAAASARLPSARASASSAASGSAGASQRFHAASAGASPRVGSEHDSLVAPPRPKATSPRSRCRATGATTAPPSTASPRSTGSRSTGSTPVAARRTSSAAITANKDNTGPAAPDVVDVGLAFGPQGVDQGLYPAVQGLDLGHHPGLGQVGRRHVVRRLLRRHVVRGQHQGRRPTSRRTGPTCSSRTTRSMVALFGDPTASNQATVRRLGRRPSANGGTLDSVEQGLDFFKQLNDAGNFVPVIASTATVASGKTPIRLALDLQRPGRQGQARGQPADRGRRPDVRPLRWHVRPGDQRLCAASERRQALDGVPLLRRRPEHLAERLLQPDPLRRHGGQEHARSGRRWPSCPSRRARVLPTLAQITAASKAITKGWPTVVGVTVK